MHKILQQPFKDDLNEGKNFNAYRAPADFFSL